MELIKSQERDKMNELMIKFKSGYVYFDTKQKNIKEAFEEFKEVLTKMNINYDNMKVDALKLRDAKHNEIEIWERRII